MDQSRLILVTTIDKASNYQEKGKAPHQKMPTFIYVSSVRSQSSYTDVDNVNGLVLLYEELRAYSHPSQCVYGSLRLTCNY